MKTSTKNNAMKIVRCLKSKSLKDITVRNLISECQVINDHEFYTGLDWLVKENKILLLTTSAETFVLPLINENYKQKKLNHHRSCV